MTLEALASEFENASRDELIAALFHSKVALLEQEQELQSREQEIDKLHHLLIQAKKKIHGKKSEKLSEQQELFSFAPEEEVTPEPVIEVKSHARIKRTKRELPESFPRERIEYDLESSCCPSCSREMPVIGEELSEELEFVPAQFKVIEHVRLKRACGACKNGVYTPSLPPEVKPLERRMAGAGLLSQIIVSKYQDHLPLHRQEQIFKRHGITLPRRLMCGWIEGAVELLMPVYEALREELLKESYLQADETTLKVQDPEVEGRLHTGYLWSILAPPGVGSKPRTFFHYAESRAGEVPKELLKDFRGRLQTDAYAGYNSVLIPSSCERIACMAHIRRKFIEAQDSQKSKAGKVLMLIADLYKLERSLKDKLPEERKERRNKKAFPLLKKLYRLIQEQRKNTLPQSPHAKALAYAWEQRAPMLRYLRDGRYEIDNNLIENQMRPVALGRKNYLFAGSHEGAKRAAVLYSLINTCKLNGVNAYDYLADVFRKVHQRGVTLQELMPQSWQDAKSMG